jgi:hypothetical protein
MSSLKQIQANRRNALKSTGPITPEGKRRSRCNAMRHGLTAEIVIAPLEDAEDYLAFEAAVISDYDAESAVERELVLRMASVLYSVEAAGYFYGFGTLKELESFTQGRIIAMSSITTPSRRPSGTSSRAGASTRRSVAAGDMRDRTPGDRSSTRAFASVLKGRWESCNIHAGSEVLGEFRLKWK